MNLLFVDCCVRGKEKSRTYALCRTFFNVLCIQRPELTSVKEIAFTYTESGSVGLCKAKKMMYISTAGGFIPDEIHTGELYMKQICDFYGIGKLETFCQEGIDILGTDVEQKMRKAEAKVIESASHFIK